ncbi:MAG TPA: CotD family spore coat protein [Candidatus Angelobacter sp.]|nr:CotD family spore coat protein [Candidatus Angelobacter sp.]
MEKQPIPHHHVYHHPHFPHPALNATMPLDLNIDSHDQFVSTDSHNTNVEQFNFENIYPMAPTPQAAPAMHQPAPMAPAQAPMGHPGCEQVCPTICDPAVFDPPQQFQTNALGNVIKPFVHPTHTVHNVHTHVVNQHYFPHSESCCYTSSCEDVICGCPCPMPCPMPCPGPMHGPMPGPMPGPGMGMHPYPHHF